MSTSDHRMEFCGLVENLIETGKDVQFRAHGASMHPSVQDGDLVMLGAVVPEQVCVGDVVAFRSAPGRMIIHRVISITRNEGRLVFITRGDSRIVADDPWESGQIVGRVSRVMRGGVEISVHGRWWLWRARLRGWVNRLRSFDFM